MHTFYIEKIFVRRLLSKLLYNIVNCSYILCLQYLNVTACFFHSIISWITLEQGKTTADAMGDVWRGLEVVEAATRVGTDMLVRTHEI